MQPALFDALPRPAHLGRADIGERPRTKALVAGTGKIKGFDYALNAYVGCGFGCTYCYAQFFVADLERRAAWGSWVDVKSGVIKEILGHDLYGKRVLMSSATDPYQPIEARVGLTREILEVLSSSSRQPHLIVQTRSPLATRDIDLFKRFKNLRVNMTIATDDDLIRQEFEPNCASINRRFEALSELKAAGIRIGVSVSPLLPLRDPEAFAMRIHKLNPEGGFLNVFHEANQPFASNTPLWVREKVRAMGWSKAKSDHAMRVLRARLPQLG